MDAIANNPDAPTFENTIEALEKSGRLLSRVQRVFGAMTQANTNPTLQDVQTAMTPKLRRVPRCDQPQSEAVCAREGGL